MHHAQKETASDGFRPAKCGHTSIGRATVTYGAHMLAKPAPFARSKSTL